MTSSQVETQSRIARFFDGAEQRIEGRDKATGRMKYAADIDRPGLLWAAYVTSPYAYAKIVRIDVTAARSVPGVKAVLTAADIGLRLVGIQLFDWPVLCHDVVRFIGDRVVAIAAETRAAAEEAVKLVEIDYDELNPILSTKDALEAEAPVLHPDWDAYHYLAYVGKERPLRSHPNLQTEFVNAKGVDDLTRVFASARHVFEHFFETPRQHCGYIEPTATVVWIDDDGTVHVHAANKSPFRVRDQLAHTAQIAREKIVIEANAVGGDFGGKGLGRDVLPCYFLARATGRPVRSVPTYAEELQFSSARHPARMQLRTAVSAEGLLLAHHAEVIYDGGAYAAVKPTPNLLFGISYGTMPYRIPDVRINIKAAYTNTLPSGYVRAPGDVQTCFAFEQHIDMIAAELGIDALTFRMRNAMQNGDTAVTGEAISEPAGMAVLEALEQDVAVRGEPPPGRARGMAFLCRHTGVGRTTVKLTLSPTGDVEIISGMADQGSGSHTVIQRVAAAALAISLDRIRVRRGSTSEAGLDPGVGASRGTHLVGGATRNAVAQLAAILEEAVGVRLTDEGFFSAGGQAASLDDIAAEACRTGPIVIHGEYDGIFHGADNPPDYSFSACSIEIELDRQTGEVTVHDALLVMDVGQIISPIGHQGQIDGGFIAGIGSALMEEMLNDESGKMQIVSLADYKLPTIADIPPLRTILVQKAGRHQPYGAKAIGEHANAGVAPAIGNALASLAGVRLCELPLTAERIYRALANPNEVHRAT
jgi:CO/xanthine dehydrogenase Mo-binding subunit